MVREFVAIFGRPGGKTEALAIFNCCIGSFCDHRAVLTVGAALCISRASRTFYQPSRQTLGCTLLPIAQPTLGGVPAAGHGIARWKPSKS
jgi:hypothetical protein